METEIWSIVLVIISGLIGGLGPIYLKKATGIINFKKFSTIYKNKFLIIGIFIYGISTIIFIPALKGGELSVLYPLIGLVYIWVSIYSIYMLKEKMNLLKWAGIITIIIGVSLIGLGV
jgi:multidrug transporter EmrE-like cation transporter